jgi:hypothetical protein
LKGGFAMQPLLNFIAVMAFVMSALTWVFALINQRRQLKIRIVLYCNVSQYHYFLVSLENLSRLPILISQIYMVHTSGEKLECRVIPKRIYDTIKTSGNNELSRETIKNMQLPIQLASLGGLSGYLAFEDHQKMLPSLTTDVNFEVHSNRGRSFRVKLPLNKVVPPNILLKLI